MVERVHQNVLIVGQDQELTRLVLELLAARGLRGTAARGPKVPADRLDERLWDLVLIDLSGEVEAGFELLSCLKGNHPELPVIMTSADASARLAVRAMREGCWEFLVKPVSRSTLEELLASLLPNRDVPLAAAREDPHCRYQIVGRSERLIETIRLARKIAPTSVSVLISGESGTGKELVAHLLHRESNRFRGPYVRVNCAAMSESLLESELFGHEKGAFTGACVQHKGKFERAHGGTLLLDEVSETGPKLQAELLRIMEQQDFERLGGSEVIRVNVRVICTSNRNLAEDVEKGRFRRDLFYRISGVHLAVPPLRDRPEDIPELIWHFVNLYAGEGRRGITALDSEMVEMFRRFAWPGNVRQLRNAVRTAIVLGEGPVLSLCGIPALQEEFRPAPARRIDISDLSLEEIERIAIFEALRRTQRNQVKAARLLGITDRTLREKLRKYHRQEQIGVTGEDRW